MQLRTAITISTLAAAPLFAGDPPRLPRDNLLLFRAANGEPAPVKSKDDWLRRAKKSSAASLRSWESCLGTTRNARSMSWCLTKLTAAHLCADRCPIRRNPTAASPPICCCPKRRRASGVLCLHPTDDAVGHGVLIGRGNGRYPAYANELAERGFVVLAPNYPLLAQYQPDLKALGWESGTLKAVWDNIRGIDLLESLPNVKPGGVAAIGHSLGGHNAVFTAIHDERIRVVVSSCGLDSFLDYYGGDPAVWQPGKGWTQTRYMPRLADYRGRLAEIPFDFSELIGALAPRHVLLIAPKNDDNFRAASVDRIVTAARPVFELYGHADRLRLEHPEGGHDFSAASRKQAYDLIASVFQSVESEMKPALIGLWATLLVTTPLAATEPSPLRVGVFDVDASPPVGSPLAYDPTTAVEAPLSCRGIVLLGDDKPIVFCAVDWIGIGNAAHQHFRERLATAVGTSVDRVAVHTLHQHDAPWCDFEIDEVLSANGLAGKQFDSGFARAVMERAAIAAAQAVKNAIPVTHIGLGRGVVKEVASNRRILGADGKVKSVRYSATKDAAIRAEPEGVIDPELKLIAFLDGDKPLVVLTYYATHPQSYYRTGRANPDFPGLARNHRQQVTGVPHIHFNGAGGNITAGKYNDGAPANRPVLAERLEAGMAKAWNALQKSPISPADVGWTSTKVALPPADHLDETSLAIDDCRLITADGEAHSRGRRNGVFAPLPSRSANRYRLLTARAGADALDAG